MELETDSKEKLADKVLQLPDALVAEVSDFVDFLLSKKRSSYNFDWLQRTNLSRLAESDLSDYLSGLEDYESRLERGEITW